MAETWTILRVLDWTRAHFESKGIEPPRLDAELILAHALGLQRVMLYARFDQPLLPEELAKIRGLVARRARGEPMAYILGERELYSLSFEVTPDVLIPRPDTEVLIELGIARMKDREAPAIADVGTGSGCIAIALAKHLPRAKLTAIDISEKALEVAKRNAAKHGVAERIDFVHGDLLAPAPGTRFELVAANLPYIARAVIPTLDRDVKDFEPRSALDGGEDGLELIRALIPQAKPRLAPGGTILLELGWDQGQAVRGLLESHGYRGARVHADLGGRDRVAEATLD